MSVSKWKYTPACDGKPCPGDCDNCGWELDEAGDLISRQAAIDAAYERIRQIGYENDPYVLSIRQAIRDLPPVQPECLTDDDFETIRIHLSAYKERLCNQNRWKEAEEYQRIIDRFMNFASAQPEIIRCKDCRWRKDQSGSTAWLPCREIVTPSDFYCGRAERRTDE